MDEVRHNKVNQPDILFASALKMTGYLRRYVFNEIPSKLYINLGMTYEKTL